MPSIAQKRRLVIADPDHRARAPLREALLRDGNEVLEVSTAAELRQLTAERPLDAVLMELDLPDENGLMVIRDLRAGSSIGIIVHTARDEQVDRIVALEMGADHYVAKGHEPRELAVRVRNLLWRMAGSLSATAADRGREQIRFEDWVLDVGKRVLRGPAGGTSTLTRQEAAILHALVRHAGQVMSRDQLMDAVNRAWNPTDRTIDVLIGRLRRKIERDPQTPELIVTIYGEGYMFTGTVQA